MKKGIILIVVAIILAGADFMTLMNQTFVTNKTLGLVGMFLMIVAGALFLWGLVSVIMSLFKKSE